MAVRAIPTGAKIFSRDFLELPFLFHCSMNLPGTLKLPFTRGVNTRRIRRSMAPAERLGSAVGGFGGTFIAQAAEEDSIGLLPFRILLITLCSSSSSRGSASGSSFGSTNSFGLGALEA